MSRIRVIATGNQAPYGIDEVIADYPNTPAGLKKAMRRAAYWYNPAVIVMPDGSRVEIDWTVVRQQDRGYADER
ncbi:MAG TPA: hypothetical protein PLH32_17605 [bacterium]|nr:hypothetical protein [bacterium]